ncbi:MAG TPA: single-stranded-DNA-specific exonuclease RecJ [Oligoflexales bacterium]|nr:single-stranded-DNA-specific exonuclease RecJ [Oligoflexales bacterium]
MNDISRWVQAEVDLSLAQTIAQAIEIPELIAKLLILRGINTPDEALDFIEPKLANLNDPAKFMDMDTATARIVKAVQKKQLICVFGDYDADGLTATTILADFLEASGADVTTFIPDRMTEGYGLQPDRVRSLAQLGIKLIITVDCGIRAHEAVQVASELGVDVIIVDHHVPDPTLPAAVAIVDPHRADCSFPFADLCAAGLAFYLIGSLRREFYRLGIINDVDLRPFLDLVAVGTIADMVPLNSDNRVFAVHGLRRLNQDTRPGLAALKAVAGIAAKNIDARAVAFSLAPRLNATGRLGDPKAALDLLRAKDVLQARTHAEILQKDNDERRIIAQKVTDEAMAHVYAEGKNLKRIIIAVGQGWHQGVIGIAAAKLVNAFNKPSIVIGLEDGIGKGSCRSVKGFDIGQAIKSAEPFLVRFGGHPMAAGLTVEEAQIPNLINYLEELAEATIDSDIIAPSIDVDAWLNLKEVTPELFRHIERLQPFGMGNPEPVLAVSKVTVTNARIVGKGKRHVQIEVCDGDTRVKGIWFDQAHLAPTIGDLVDVAFNISLDDRLGEAKMKIIDVRQAT